MVARATLIAMGPRLGGTPFPPMIIYHALAEGPFLEAPPFEIHLRQQIVVLVHAPKIEIILSIDYGGPHAYMRTSGNLNRSIFR